MKHGLAMAMIIGLCTLLTGCSQNTTAPASSENLTPTPTPQVRTLKASLDMTERSTAKLPIQMSPGERVELEIKTTQQDDPWARCARPSLVDPFDNSVADLKPIESDSTESIYVYRYAFIAATEGEYWVEFENLECVVRKTPVEVEVIWAIHDS